jgi:hypothetical protein
MFGANMSDEKVTKVEIIELRYIDGHIEDSRTYAFSILIIPDKDIKFGEKYTAGNRVFLSPQSYEIYKGWQASPILDDVLNNLREQHI